MAKIEKVPANVAVRTIREKLNLTQEQLAPRLQCSYHTVRKLESDGRLPKNQAVRGNLFELAKEASVEIEE